MFRTSRANKDISGKTAMKPLRSVPSIAVAVWHLQ